MRPLRDRLYEKTIPEPNSGCLLWTEAVNAKGYGRINRGRNTDGKILTHRAVWELERGPIPTGMKVLHKCDTPSCVNVGHLFIGTDADNAHDRESKGRGGGHKIAGANNKNAKLTPEKVSAIRDLLTTGCSISDLSVRFKVSECTIYDVRAKRRWA